MSVSLATRGYICTRFPFVAGIPPPTIVGSDEVTPEIKGSATIEAAAPAIVSGRIVEPSIRGATKPTPVQPPPIPTITKGEVVAPDIRKSKKE